MEVATLAELPNETAEHGERTRRGSRDNDDATFHQPRAVHVRERDIRRTAASRAPDLRSQCGEKWTEPPEARHIVSANASNIEPARLIACIIADDSAQPTVYDK